MKTGKVATEASFYVVHILTMHKKLFTDGRMVEEAMTVMAETLLRLCLLLLMYSLLLTQWQGESVHFLQMQKLI